MLALLMAFSVFFKSPLVNGLNYINGVNGKFSTIVDRCEWYCYYKINGVKNAKQQNFFC